jgi:4-hydroxy-tetrahydrodipicolinate reductase
MTIKIAIIGAAGRMGRMLVQEVLAAPDLALAGALEHHGSSAVGQDAGLVAGTSSSRLTITTNADEAINQADIAVDFTTPENTARMLELCCQRNVGLVLGTTGLSPAQRADVGRAARQIPLVFAPNTSVGINVLIQLVQQATALLGPGYDLEIVETHHRQKKDAPSGTALRLAEALVEASEARGTLALRACYGRHGLVGERPAAEIGIHTVRGGDVVGDHTVFYLADGERLELTHRASSRQTFARGAIRAARWLAGRSSGLYDMQHVLGLKATS